MVYEQCGLVEKEVNDHSDATVLANIPHSNSSNHVVGGFEIKIKITRYKENVWGQYALFFQVCWGRSFCWPELVRSSMEAQRSSTLMLRAASTSLDQRLGSSDDLRV